MRPNLGKEEIPRKTLKEGIGPKGRLFLKGWIIGRKEEGN